VGERARAGRRIPRAGTGSPTSSRRTGRCGNGSRLRECESTTSWRASPSWKSRRAKAAATAVVAFLASRAAGAKRLQERRAVERRAREVGTVPRRAEPSEQQEARGQGDDRW